MEQWPDLVLDERAELGVIRCYWARDRLGDALLDLYADFQLPARRAAAQLVAGNGGLPGGLVSRRKLAVWRIGARPRGREAADGEQAALGLR